MINVQIMKHDINKRFNIKIPFRNLNSILGARIRNWLYTPHWYLHARTTHRDKAVMRSEWNHPQILKTISNKIDGLEQSKHRRERKKS